ncbi:MAG: transcription termination/antitermination NusG family protein [Candidatus Dojkabacteria bacterium]|nr:transcription termination/antitermination NusG family protein [Candidatus Dojkabacteria bacterium]
MTEEKKSKKKKVDKKTKKPVKQSASKKSKSTGVKGQEWYIVNTYSGYENKVATQLTARIKANSLENVITEIVVPTQDKIVISKGKKKTVKEKIFPGYVLIKMLLNDNTWQVVRNTEGIVGFV